MQLIKNFFVLLMACAFSVSAADKPDWVVKRPDDPAFYIGIAMAEKKGDKSEYRKKAEQAALLDMASMISVNIAGEFINVVTESTGINEDFVRSEIRASAATRFTGHELVDTWENRKEYWVYYRIPKAIYKKQRQADFERASQEAEKWGQEAEKETACGKIASAVGLYARALYAIESFAGDPSIDDAEKLSSMLIKYFSALQRSIQSLSISTDRSKFFALAGMPMEDTLEATVASKGAALTPQQTVPLTVKTEKENMAVVTDNKGIAKIIFKPLDEKDNGITAKISVALDRLLPQEIISPLIKSILLSIPAPESLVTFRVFHQTEKEKYYLAREFDSRNVIICCVYRNGGKTSEWKKMHDEIMVFAKNNGAIIKKTVQKIDNVLEWCANPDSNWDIADAEPDDLIIIAAADGKINKRQNPQNPSGEDVQFSGDIFVAVHSGGKPHFADRFSGTGGWNPMGEQMCMDVLALNVMKRFKPMYLKSLGIQSE